MDSGYIPIAPHIYFTQFMNDDSRKERDLALFMDIVLLTKCAELWVFGNKVTSGMSIEIAKAKRNGQTIRYFTESCEEVSGNEKFISCIRQQPTGKDLGQ